MIRTTGHEEYQPGRDVGGLERADQPCRPASERIYGEERGNARLRAGLPRRPGGRPVVNPVSGRNGEAATSAAVPVPATRPAVSVAFPGERSIQRSDERRDRRADRHRGDAAGRCSPSRSWRQRPTTPIARPADTSIEGWSDQHQRKRDTGGDEHPLAGPVEPRDAGESAERDCGGRGPRGQQRHRCPRQRDERHQPGGAPAEERRRHEAEPEPHRRR